MQRQRSILSFLSKPSPDSLLTSAAGEVGGGGVDPVSASQGLVHRRRPIVPMPPNRPVVVEDADVVGVDTPPEKPPRPFFPRGAFGAGGGGGAAQPVSSILQKLRRGGDEAEFSVRR